MKKTTRYFLMMIIIISTFYSACAPGTDTSEDKTAVKTKQELTLAICERAYGRSFWDETVRLFEAENPGYKVTLKIGPNIGDVIRPDIIAGNPPDFINISDVDPSGVLSALIQNHGLLELTDVFNGPAYDSAVALRDKIGDGLLESYKCAPYGDGKIYLAPGAITPAGLVYNKTLFAEHNWDLPVTWNDFFALGEAAKKEGLYLFTYQGMYPFHMESLLLPALASALGSDYEQITDFSPGIWTDERSLYVLEQISRIYRDGHLLPGSISANHIDAKAAHMRDSVLFFPGGTWLAAETDAEFGGANYQMALAPAPVPRAGDERFIAIRSEQFSIPLAAQNPEAAQLFLRFLYSDRMAELYAKRSDALMSVKDSLLIARPHLSEGAYNMFRVINDNKTSPLLIGFAAIPDDTDIAPCHEIYGPLAKVMTGKMDALKWAEDIEQAFREMRCQYDY